MYSLNLKTGPNSYSFTSVFFNNFLFHDFSAKCVITAWFFLVNASVIIIIMKMLLLLILLLCGTNKTQVSRVLAYSIIFRPAWGQVSTHVLHLRSTREWIREWVSQEYLVIHVGLRCLSGKTHQVWNTWEKCSPGVPWALSYPR